MTDGAGRRAPRRGGARSIIPALVLLAAAVAVWFFATRPSAEPPVPSGHSPGTERAETTDLPAPAPIDPVSVTSPAEELQPTDARETPEREPISVSDSRGATLRIEVVDPTGFRVPNYKVAIENVAMRWGIVHDRTPGHEAVWRDVPPGWVTVRVTPIVHSTEHETIELVEGESRTLTIVVEEVERAWLQVALVDDDGAPVPGVIVRGSNAAGESGPCATLPPDAPHVVRVPVTGTSPVTLVARAPDRPVVVEEGITLDDSPLTLTFPALATLEVTVVDQYGSAVEGVEVSLGPAREPDVHAYQGDDFPDAVTTDARGVAFLENVIPIDLRVFVRREGASLTRAEVSVTPGSRARVSITLPEIETVRGTLVVDGAPAVGWRVDIEGEDDFTKAETDAEGRFEVKLPAVGRSIWRIHTSRGSARFTWDEQRLAPEEPWRGEVRTLDCIVRFVDRSGAPVGPLRTDVELVAGERAGAVRAWRRIEIWESGESEVVAVPAGARGRLRFSSPGWAPLDDEIVFDREEIVVTMVPARLLRLRFRDHRGIATLHRLGPLGERVAVPRFSAHGIRAAFWIAAERVAGLYVVEGPRLAPQVLRLTEIPEAPIDLEPLPGGTVRVSSIPFDLSHETGVASVPDLVRFEPIAPATLDAHLVEQAWQGGTIERALPLGTFRVVAEAAGLPLARAIVTIEEGARVEVEWTAID